MPSVTIPLAGQLNTRGQTQLSNTTGNIDQRFRNCDFGVVKNPIAGDAKMYIQKRWGLSSYITTGASAIANAGFLVSVTGDIISAFGTIDGTVYVGSTNVGDAGGKVLHISEASISGKQYYFITDSAGSGWYLVSDSYSQTAYTGNRTSGSPVISGIATTDGMYAGQLIVGDAGIPANTRILSVDSGTQITLTQNATSGAATSTTLTKTPLARFIDADFPSLIVGKFVYLDGYLFIMDKTNKRIYQSGLNNISSWAASDYITVQSSGETAAGIARVGSRIAALCSGSIEFFYNAGNPSGSVLTSQKELFRRIGVSGGSATDASSTVPVYAYSGDTVFFLGTEGGQSRGIYAMAGTEIKKISTPEIDRQISRSASSVYWIISAFHDRGKNYVLVSEASSPRRQFFGCLETGMWPEGQMTAGWMVAAGGIVGYTGAATTDTSMVFGVSSDGTAGLVYRLRSDVYTDNGTAFTLSCQTSKQDFGTENLKTVKNVALLGTDIQSAINYLNLDGSSGCYASTPDSASVSITGDIDLRIRLSTTDWTPSEADTFIAKRANSSDQISYIFRNDTSGNLVLLWTVDGAIGSLITKTSTSSVSFDSGHIAWVRATLDVDNGAAGNDVKFYTSIDGSTWTQLGSTVTTAGTTSIYDSTSIVEIGAQRTGQGNLLSGNVYYAEIRNGIGGTVVAKFDPSNDASEGDTSFTSSTGEVWTINGTASIEDGQVATLEYSDDDYSTWTTAGSFKLTTSNPRIFRLGAYRGGRAWRLTHSADSAFRAQALKFEYDVGKH